MAYYNIPPSIELSGDHAKAQSWIGYAKEQVRVLFGQLSFQKLKQGSMTVNPEPGVSIFCQVIFGQPFVRIGVKTGYEQPVDKKPEDIYRVKFMARPFDIELTREHLGDYAADFLTDEMIDGFDFTLDNLVTYEADSPEDSITGRVSFIAVKSSYNPGLVDREDYVTPEDLYSLGEIVIESYGADPIYKYNIGSEPYLADPPENNANLFFDGKYFCIIPPPGVAKDQDLLINPLTGEVAIWAFISVGERGYVQTQSGDIYDKSWYCRLSHACKKNEVNVVSVPFSAFVSADNDIVSTNTERYISASTYPNLTNKDVVEEQQTEVDYRETFMQIGVGDDDNTTWMQALQFDLHAYASTTRNYCEELGINDIRRYQYITYNYHSVPTIHSGCILFSANRFEFWPKDSIEEWGLLTNVQVKKGMSTSVDQFPNSIGKDFVSRAKAIEYKYLNTSGDCTELDVYSNPIGNLFPADDFVILTKGIDGPGRNCASDLRYVNFTFKIMQSIDGDKEDIMDKVPLYERDFPMNGNPLLTAIDNQEDVVFAQSVQYNIKEITYE